MLPELISETAMTEDAVKKALKRNGVNLDKNGDFDFDIERFEDDRIVLHTELDGKELPTVTFYIGEDGVESVSA